MSASSALSKTFLVTTVAEDISDRDLQKSEKQIRALQIIRHLYADWSVRHTAWMSATCRSRCAKNGEVVKQQARTGQMIYQVAK